MSILEELELTISERQEADPNSSWTARLLERGRSACAKKLGEEAVEVALAGAYGSKDELVHEAADLLYHLLVLLAANETTINEVFEELERRRGVSGIEEKQRRTC